MSKTIEIKQLAKLLGITGRGIRKRARRENWTYKIIAGRGRGGKKRLYAVESLPIDVRLALLEANKLEHKDTQDLDLEQAETEFNKLERASDKSKKKAHAWEKIIINFEASRSGRKLEDFKPEYVAQYNAGNVFLGISSETYRIVPRISESTLKRKRTRYKRHGLIGLLDSDQRGRPKPKLTPAEVEYILGLLMQNPHRRPRWICKYYQNKFGLVSNKTVRRLLASFKKQNAQLWALIKNPDAWRNKFQAAPGDASLKARYFLHLLEIDCTPADVICADGRRYTLIAIIDTFSRKAKCLVVPTGSSAGVLNLIRNVVTHKDWGLFDVLVHDNGKEFTADAVKIACKLLNIERIQLPPFAPWLKPFIERFFRTLSIYLEENIGFCGHDVAQKKEIESRKSFAERMLTKGESIEIGLTRDELQAKINNFLNDIYHQEVHSALGMCPEAKSAQSSRPVRNVEDTEALKVLLAPCGQRVCQKKGIYYENGIYWANELAVHIGEQVQLRRDFGDVGLIYVFDLKMKFICVARDTSLEGITLEEAKEARKLQKKQVHEQARAAKALAKKVGDPMGELLEMKRKKPGRIHAVHKKEIFENNAILEAGRAVKMRTEQEINERERVAIEGGRISMARLWSALGQKKTETPERKYRLVKD